VYLSGLPIHTATDVASRVYSAGILAVLVGRHGMMLA